MSGEVSEPEEGWDRLRTSVFAGTAAEDQAWGENGGEEGEPYPTTVDEEGRTQPAGMFEALTCPKLAVVDLAQACHAHGTPWGRPGGERAGSDIQNDMAPK